MKKLFVFILITLFLFSCASAESEITFLNIPWLSDDASVFQAISDADYLRDGLNFALFANEDGSYIVSDEITNYRATLEPSAEDVCYSISLDGYVKGKIAGQPIKDIILTFAYDGEYKFISANIKLINADYSVLKRKLTELYNEGEQRITEEGIESVIWRGDNNSAVLLYTESQGDDFTLIYGRLDAAEILASCLISDPDDVSGL